MPQLDPLKNFAAVAPKYMAMLIADTKCSLLDACAVFGNAGYESKGLTDDQEDKPVVPGSRGGLNWMQWTGPRRVAMEAYCARNKLDPNSDEAAYKWLILELGVIPGQGGEEKRALSAMAVATNLEDKVIAFEKSFLRAGVKNYPGRVAWAQRALTAYNEHIATQANDAAQEEPGEDAAPSKPINTSSGGWFNMNWLSILVGKTALQYLLNAIGGVVIAKGWVDGDTWAQIAGAVLVLVPALAGVFDSATPKAVTKAGVVKLAALPLADKAKVEQVVDKAKGA